MNPQVQQLLSIYIPLLSPLATLAIVMVGFIYNNSRMSDLRSDLLGRMSDLRSDMTGKMDDTRDLMRAEMKKEIAELRAETNARFDRLEAKVDKLTETVLHMLADHEQRLNRLEQR